MPATQTVVSGPVPAGRHVCPECSGSGMVGTQSEDRDPQKDTSTDCPRCDPRNGSASVGHVARITGRERAYLNGHQQAPR